MEYQNSFPILRRLIAPHPSIKDVGEQRRASLLAGFGLAIAPLTLAATIAGYVTRSQEGYSQFGTLLALSLCIASTATYLVSRTRLYRIGSFIIAAAFLAITVGLEVVERGPLNETLYSMLPILFVVSIALFDLRGMWILFVATMLSMGIIFTFGPPVGQRAAIQAAGITGSIAVLSIVVVAYRDSVEKARLAEMAALNREVTASRDQLELRVQERTADLNQRNATLEVYAKQLEAISKVARAIATIQDIDVLLPTITRLVSEQFGFYHTGIFLLDERAEYAVLRAANSEGGKRMLKRNHRLRLGTTGIVGFVAARGESRIVLDVGADAVYFNNPDLPATRSEIALPLRSGAQIIGVLDVQSTETNAFHQDDIAVLETLADQVAVAIENARLFSQTRQALAEAQTIYQQYIKQDWSRFARRLENKGYTYDGIRAVPLNEPLPAPQGNALSIPVRIRGMVVGQVAVRPGDPLRQWTQNEVNMARAAAERAGLAIENMRLLTEAQRRAAKEHTIAEVAARISTSASVPEIMRSAAEELGRVLPGSEVVIQFVPKTEEAS